MAIRERVEETYAQFKTNLKTILMNIGVGLIAVSYVVYNTLTLKPTDLNPLLLISEAVLAIIAALLIKAGLGENGFVRGYKTVIWLRALERYDKKAKQAEPYLDRANEFYEKERIEKRIRNRKVRLSSYRMKYETFFDENGDYIEHEIWSPRKKKRYLRKHESLPADVVVLDIRQALCLYKCVKLKIYPRDMFDQYGIGLSDDERKEKTDKMQRSSNMRKNLLSAIGFSLAGVYFVPVLTSWNWAAIIWASFQVISWVMFGLIDDYDNYNYVTVEKVGILGGKEKDISRFMIWCIGREEFIKKQVDEIMPSSEEVVVEMTEEEAREKGLL